MNKYIKAGFEDEMEKNAQALLNIFKALGKFTGKLAPKLTEFFGGGVKALEEGGAIGSAAARKNLADYLVQFRTPDFIKNPKTGFMEAVGGSHDSGFIKSEFGNAVQAIRNLRQGLKEQPDLSSKIRKFGKNLWAETKRDFKNQTYKIVKEDPKYFAKPVFSNKGGKIMMKEQSWLPSRQVLSDPLSESKIVKKRLGVRALAYTGTPVGMLGLGTVMDPSHPIKNTIDAAAWKFGMGPGLAVQSVGL